MAENSGIGWTDHTMNFWWGCHKVSTECQHCYIDGLMKLTGRQPFNGPMRTVDWSKPANLRMLEEIDADTFASTNRDLRDRTAELQLEIEASDRGRNETIDIAVRRQLFLPFSDN